MKYFSENTSEFPQQLKSAFGAADKNFSPITLKSYIESAESEVIFVIGTATADKVLTDEATLTIIRRIVANWSLEVYANSGAIRIGDAGIHVEVGQNRSVASDKKVLAFKRDCQELGCKALEELINTFEVRSAEFGEWRLSNERKQYFDTLFRSSNEFGPFGGVPITASLYRNIKRQIQFVQDDYLQPILGTVLLEKLIGMSVVALNATDNEKRLQRLAMRVVAPMAIADALAYRVVELRSDGVYQRSISAAGSNDNIEEQAVAGSRSLSGISIKLTSEFEANRVKLIKFLVDNAVDFPTAPVTQKSIYPVQQMNDDPTSNIYFC
ncbi:hypothetical protein OHD16_21405 [Sphingobacterium sp. ML3W]|uniref:DUF6712 family protein n=1 Tax=Sphingobacterium sp. ML3W TaxID=1538644 RepID=UPI00249B8290|nr:DUF6712 family protein [Sphingobacterium sp. ML3W]WFA77289.1 hypothetical protein OGI71_14545 [Sphingobacterium sp. ML3W]